MWMTGRSLRSKTDPSCKRFSNRIFHRAARKHLPITGTDLSEIMRILIVTQYFWPESFRINDLAIGLRDRGHEVTVLTGLPNYPTGRLFPGYNVFSRSDDFQGIRVIRVPLITRGQSKGMRLIANYLSFAMSACLLGPWLCRPPVDVVFVFQPSPILVGWPAIVMKWWTKAPILFWVQDLWPDSLLATGTVKSGWVTLLVDRIVRQIYRHCDRVLIQSPGFREPIEHQAVPASRIVEFPNWAESLYQPLELSASAPERAEVPRGFRILFAGNIGTSQSFPTILRAAELCLDEPELKWVILGDGREKASVEEQVRSRGLSDCVHLLGHRPVEMMPRYFATADVLLLTLKRDPAFARVIPSKLQSYLACGKPILGGLDGDGAEVIRNADAGLVVPAEDAEALAAAARRMLRSSVVERERWGLNGLRYSRQHFDRQVLLDRLEQLFREVIGWTFKDQIQETPKCAA